MRNAILGNDLKVSISWSMAAVFCDVVVVLRMCLRAIPLAIFSGAPTARRAAKRSPILRNPWNSFLMVKMASGIAQGRVRATTTASHNMAVIFQRIGHAASVNSVHLWYWTSILWLTDTSPFGCWRPEACAITCRCRRQSEGPPASESSSTEFPKSVKCCFGHPV